MKLYPELPGTDPATLDKKDFQTEQDVRWCPGCGDYAILAQVQRTLPSLGIAREKYVFISGIGCSSRFPYYMGTYGLHSIHGRAPAVATGVKALRPELSVWVITGDGDSLSIGGNHTAHVLRRNVDLNILLFNNQIYGLTKGQYSPTSEVGKRTKSTPFGSIDHPFNPLSFALGADASFVARAIDVDGPGLQAVLERGAAHRGASFVEILQNCNIFNDGAFAFVTERRTKADTQLHLKHGQPMLYGSKGAEKGIGIGPDLLPRVIDVAQEGAAGVLVHDETNPTIAWILAHLTHPEFPTPLGVLRCVKRDTYDAAMAEQIEVAKARKPAKGGVQALLDGGQSWTVT